MGKKNKGRGYTHQGVRDLNALGPRKSVGIRLEMPPDPETANCPHPEHLNKIDEVSITCGKCGSLLREL